MCGRYGGGWLRDWFWGCCDRGLCSAFHKRRDQGFVDDFHLLLLGDRLAVGFRHLLFPWCRSLFYLFRM